jgi:hypothetical protein
MERLWIEFGGEGLDALCSDADARGAVQALSNFKVFGVSFGHFPLPVSCAPQLLASRIARRVVDKLITRSLVPLLENTRDASRPRPI